jgi:Cys-tRNA(Pro)/Cys-tRNA(Cys) deacylase
MKALAITAATIALDSSGVPYTLRKFESDTVTGFGKEAAIRMTVDEDQVFKTILFGDKEMAVVAIAPVSREISTKRLAAAVGVRNLEPMESALAQKMSGYVLGGISPFGQKKQLDTVVDSSADNFEAIYVSGGRRGLEICIAPTDLIHALNALVAHIHAE